MKNMGGRRFNDQGTEGANITLVGVVAILALSALGVEPGIAGDQYPLRGGLYRPGFGGIKIVI